MPRSNHPAAAKIFFLICSFLVPGKNQLLSQELNIGIPHIRHFTSEEYQGGILNWSITQDKRGIIYVANNFGMLEFDGSSWNRYEVSKTGTKVRDVMVAENGFIYVASQGDFGYFEPDKQGKLSYNSLADSLPPESRNIDESWKIFQSGLEFIFCTNKNIYIKTSETEFRIIDTKFPAEAFFLVKQQLYIMERGAGLFVLQDDELRLINDGEFFSDKFIASIIPFNDEQLLITTTDNGIYLYNGITVKKWDVSMQLQNNSFNSVIRLRNGNYAFGTVNNGLIIANAAGDILFQLNKTNGLKDRKVLSLFQDIEDNLWVGHNNGISYIEMNLPFTFIGEALGLPGTGYDGYLDGNNLYLGTSNGLFVKDITDPTLNPFEFVPNTQGQVYSLDKIQNRLLVGHHEGSYDAVPNGATKISEELGGWKFLTPSANPAIMIGGTYRGLQLFKKENGIWKYQQHMEGFDESSRVLEEDQDGTLWMTHGYKGVYKLKLSTDYQRVEEVKFYGTDSGLPTNQLNNVYKIRNQIVFTTEAQVYKYNPIDDRFELDEFFQPYFDQNQPINALAEDVFDNIYFIGQNNLAGMLKKNPAGDYEKITHIFNKVNNMMNDDLTNINILNGTYVLFGAQEGFILYDHKKASNLGSESSTLIRRVKVTGRKDSVIFDGNYLLNGSITSIQPGNYRFELPYIDNSLIINYSAPFMDGLSETAYQYMLEDFEDEWNSWNSKTEKEYTNLREGTYTFHVRAKNYSDQLVPESTFTFTILPPWYRTTTSYAIAWILGFSLLIIGFKALDKRHKNEQHRLKLKSSNELNKKELLLQSITEKSEAEIEHLKNDKLESEIAHKNKELATSTVHLLNKNDFIAGIKGTIGSLLKISKNPEVKSELSKIVKNIDRNISHDSDWEHFEYHFDQVHGSFSERLQQEHSDLSPQEMKISTLLRMNMSTKEIANLLNISVRGVEISRYRLRKRLRIQREVNLTEYLLKF